MNGGLWWQLMTSGLVIMLAILVLSVWITHTRWQRWCGYVSLVIGLSMVALVLLLIWGGVHP